MRKKQLEKIKCDNMMVKLSQQALHMGRTLSHTLYGSEDKLDDVIEQALIIYATHEKKKNSGETGQRSDSPSEEVFKPLILKEDNLTNQLTELLSVSSFESILTERMVRELYCRDENSQARYNELRAETVKQMKKRFKQISTVEILELRERTVIAERELAKLNDELEVLTKQKAELQKRCDELIHIKNRYNEAVKSLQDYVRLTQWYERRDKEVPQIQEQTKSLFTYLTYEDAMKEFENKTRKPEVIPINFV